MNCDRVRLLLGVFDEMDRATREAVQQHMSGCGECAMAWADELEFRRLMASRRRPEASPKARAALLTIPPPGARRSLVSSLLASMLPAALLVASLAAAVAVMVEGGLVPRAMEDAASRPAATVVVRRGPGSGAVPARVGAPTAVKVEAEVDRSGAASRRGAIADGPRAASAPAAPRPASAVGLGQSAPPAARATAAPTAAPTAPPSRPGSGPGRGGAAPAPTRGQEPTAVPTVVVAARSLRVVAVTDLAGGDAPACPGCDGVRPDDAAAARERPVAKVRVRVTAWTAQNQASPVGALVLEPVDAGTAAGTMLVPEADAYEVTFEGADAGFILCSGQPASVRLAAAGGAEGGILATFRLWQGCPAPVPVPAP